MSIDTLDTLFAAFPQLNALDAGAQRLLRDALREVMVPAGTTVFSDGSACEHYLLLLEGSVRVQKVAETGREIVLYRVEPGQTCVLTTSCLVGQGVYGADGLTESDVRALLLSPVVFDQLLNRSAVFRQFVFSAYATRISDLLMLVEEVAFGRIDERLAQVLLTKAKAGDSLSLTHHDLAMELGSAREVISRQLKEFERRNWLRLGRGRIDLTDRAALRMLAGR